MTRNSRRVESDLGYQDGSAGTGSAEKLIGDQKKLNFYKGCNQRQYEISN